MFRHIAILLSFLIAIPFLSNCTPSQTGILPTLLATPGSSPTITNTPVPPDTATPPPPTFQQRLESVEGVISIVDVNTIDFDPGGSGAYLEVEVSEGYNTQETAIELWTHTLEHVTAEYPVPAPLDFNLIISHEGTQTAWRNDGTSSTWTHPDINPPPTDTPAPVSAQSEVCSCSGDYYNCNTFSRQSSAQACYNYCQSQGRGDIHQLDGNDKDGRVCESLP